MAKYEDLKELTEVVQNFFNLVLYVLLTLFCILYAYPVLKSTLKDKQIAIDKIDLAGVSLSLSDKLNSNGRINTKTSSDIKVDIASKDAAIQVDSALSKNVHNYWVYIGQYNPATKTWRSRIFNFSDVPTASESIKASMDVYKRESPPVEISPGDWQLGKIIGVVKANSTVHVINAQQMTDDNYWALVN